MLARSAVLGVAARGGNRDRGGKRPGPSDHRRPVRGSEPRDGRRRARPDRVRLERSSRQPACNGRRPRRVEGLSACGRARRVRRARHRPGERKEPHRGRRDSGNRSRIARGRQLPDHRTGHLGAVAAAVHLPDDRVRAARWIDARSAARCELLGPDGRPARLSIDVGPGDLQAAARRRRASTGRRKDHHQRGQDRQLHRARRDRHDEPRHLSECRAARSHERAGADARFAAERMEPPPDRAARFGLPLGLVHPGRTFRRQHSRQPAAGARATACSSTRSITRPTAATRSSPPKRR